MKMQRFVIALIVINLVLLFLIVGPSGYTPVAQTDPLVLRGRALELVDDSGQVRAQIDVEADGQVVFRLRDETGAIRVKLGADEHGSGFILMDEATEPALQMIARQTGTPNSPTTTSITVRGVNGQEQVITP